MNRSRKIFLLSVLLLLCCWTVYWLARVGWSYSVKVHIQRANHPEWGLGKSCLEAFPKTWKQLHVAENSPEIYITGGGVPRILAKTIYIVAGRLAGKKILFSSNMERSVIADGDNFLYFMGVNDHSEVQEIRLLRDLSKICGEKRVGMWQMVIPNKQLRDLSELPCGVRSYDDIKHCEMLRQTTGLGIHRVDAGKLFRESGLRRTKLFYRTDHHWTPLGALLATRTMAKQFFPEDPVFQKQLEQLDDKNFTPVTNAPIRLQQQGEELGQLLTAREGSTIYLPKESSPVRYSIWTERLTDAPVVKTGQMRGLVIQGEPQNFNYARYLHGENHRLQRIENLSVAAPRKILVIQDSFGRPVSTFLALIFRQITIIDPRFYTYRSLLATVQDQKFDLLVYCRSRNSIGQIGIWE